MSFFSYVPCPPEPTAYEIGQASGYLHIAATEKQASDATINYSLRGKLYISSSGWLLMQVPNDLGRGAFDALHEPGVVLPSRSSTDRYNAHVSVMTAAEVAKIGGPDKITERGHDVAYTLGPVKTVAPTTWDGVSMVWYIAVRSPELEKIRKSYGLPPLIKDHDFHITFAIRRTHALRNDGVSKAADWQQAAKDTWTSIKTKMQDPAFQRDLITVGGMTGIAGGLSGLTEAVTAPPGYRAEAAGRGVFSGAAGALAGFAALKATRAFANPAADVTPQAAALAGLGAYATERLIREAKYPAEQALFGRPSWEIRPDNIVEMLKQDLADDKQDDQHQDGTLKLSSFFARAARSTPIRYDASQGPLDNVLKHFNRVREAGNRHITEAAGTERLFDAMQPDRVIPRAQRVVTGRQKPLVSAPVDRIMSADSLPAAADQALRAAIGA